MDEVGRTGESGNADDTNSEDVGEGEVVCGVVDEDTALGAR